MGMFGVGPFENDEACDWLEEFKKFPNIDRLSEAFDQYLEDESRFEVALAAAEIVASFFSEVREEELRPLGQWVAHQSSGNQLAGLVDRAKMFVKDISKAKEIKELFEDDTSYKQWSKVQKGLLLRLGRDEVKAIPPLMLPRRVSPQCEISGSSSQKKRFPLSGPYPAVDRISPLSLREGTCLDVNLDQKGVSEEELLAFGRYVSELNSPWLMIRLSSSKKKILSDLTFLRAFHGLRRFSLSLPDPYHGPNLSLLTGVEEISLDFPATSRLLSSLKSCTNLTSLTLQRGWGDAKIAPLSGCSDLTGLRHLSFRGQTEMGVQEKPVVLETDHLPPFLQHIELDNCHILEDLLDRFVNSLVRINCFNCSFSGKAPLDFSAFHRLRSILLSKCSKMKSIDLDHRTLSFLGMSDLSITPLKRRDSWPNLLFMRVDGKHVSPDFFNSVSFPVLLFLRVKGKSLDPTESQRRMGIKELSSIPVCTEQRRRELIDQVTKAHEEWVYPPFRSAFSALFAI